MQMKTIKQVQIAILIYKIEFRTKFTAKDKDKHYIMIKGSIQEEDITFVNIYTLNIGAAKYIK